MKSKSHGHWYPELNGKLRWLWFNLMYFRRPPWDTRVSPPELLQFLENHPSGKALDLGCGTGTNLITMASYGWQVTGVEYAWRAVQIACNRLKQAGETGKVWSGDVTTLKYIQDRFDLVLDMGCYHGIPRERRPAYRENLLKWLAPGGSYLLYAHCQVEGKPVGISEDEIRMFESVFYLRERQDGIDNRERRAVWLRFERA